MGRRQCLITVVAIVVVAGAGLAAVQLVHRTEVLDISRIEARSDDAELTVVVGHNECSNDPTAHVVGETPDEVTVRAERRRDLLADSCDDIGLSTPFQLVLAEPLGERVVLVDAATPPSECVIDGAASDRCAVAGG